MHACQQIPNVERVAAGYGSAIEVCLEDRAGRFVVDNGEYASYVRFCPFCGTEAPAPPPVKPK